MTTVVERTEPDYVRDARKRLAEIEAIRREAGEAIADLESQVESARGQREAARGRGDLAAVVEIDRMVLDVTDAIARRREQLARLTPRPDGAPIESDVLSQLVSEWQQRVQQRDRLAANIEGIQRAAARERLRAELADRIEADLEWFGQHPCDYPPYQHERLIVQMGGGGGVYHIRGAEACLPDMRRQLAKMDRELWR